MISVVVLFLVATLIGLLLPSTVVVSRATDIQITADSVRPLLVNLNRWPEWVEGVKDNGFAVTTAQSTGVGAKAKVNGNIITLTGIKPNSVTSLWEGSNSFTQDAAFNLFTDSANTVTTIQWSFTQHIGWYPWERLGSFMNDKILGPVMEKSLENLKHRTEQPQ